MWIREAITDGEIDALREAATRAWGVDTCGNHRTAHPDPSTGQCYVTARWLVSRLGGSIGVKHGHYAWLSPDHTYVLDLTGNHTGQVIYEENDGYTPYPVVTTDRTARFSKRADRLFDNLGTLLKLGVDFAGDAYPAEQPQAESDRDQFDSYWHDEPMAETPSGVYQFVYANGQLEVSPNHDHTELAEHAGVASPDGHTGPFVAGHVSLTNGRATWEAHSNINLYGLQKILKDYCKQVGWEWGGLTDQEGQPINDDFAPARTARHLNYAYDGTHLWLGRTSRSELALRSLDGSEDGSRSNDLRTGSLLIQGDRVEVSPVHVAALPSLYEWATDSGLTLYAANDNVTQRIPDLEVDNIYAEPAPIRPRPSEPRLHEREQSGLYRCPACSQLFPRWELYQKHRREEESWGDPLPEDGKFPELPGHDELNQDNQLRTEPGITTGAVMVVNSWREASRVDGFTRYAKAFDFDNDEHTHYVAYWNGSPVGYASLKGEEIKMVQSAIENQGIGSALLQKVMRYNDRLYTHAAHEKTASLLARHGWVNAGGQKWKWSKGDQPKDMIEQPVPFIYDVDKDQIIVGHAGARTADIPGKFTPGGIVEGQYEPGGKVIIRSLTSMPYTVRHMVELWYYQQPHMEVTSVHLQDDAGKDTRLASATLSHVNVATRLNTAWVSSPAASSAIKALANSGGRVYIVGGAVRDAIRGEEPNDVDLMVTGLPADHVRKILAALPGRVDLTGKDFGVFRYKRDGDEVEVALPRREKSTRVEGEFGTHTGFEKQADHKMSVEEDLARRDYTVNAIAYDLQEHRLIDPFGGYSDIEGGVLQTTSSTALLDDPLRVVRGLVLNARFGFEPSDETRTRMAAASGGIPNLSAERIQKELDKLFEAPRVFDAIRLAHNTGVLGHIFPEVDEVWDWSQNNPHHELALGQHCASVMGRLALVSDDPDLRLAGLLHDIGKKPSMWVDPETGSYHFYAKHNEDGTVTGADHEIVGAEMAVKRLRALKYPEKRIARIKALIENHMFGAFTAKKGARKFLAKVGDHADDLMLLRWADNGGKSEYKSDPEISVDKQRSLIDLVRNEEEATDKSQLAINGHDLIEAGITPGPKMGKIFEHLMNEVLENPEMNTREYLLTSAQNYERLNA